MNISRLVLLLVINATLYAKLPLVFEENRGQTDARVDFVARGNGYTAFLSPSGATVSIGGAAVTMRVAGARAAQLEAESPLASYSNYFVGNDPARWLKGVRHYGTVRAKGILDGIDLV